MEKAVYCPMFYPERQRCMECRCMWYLTAHTNPHQNQNKVGACALALMACDSMDGMFYYRSIGGESNDSSD